MVDAVMYLVRTITSRGRRITTMLAVRNAPDAASGARVLRDALPPLARDALGDAEIEAVRARIMAASGLPDRPHLRGEDWVGAVGIFLIVVASTFPVALPFVIFHDLPTAKLVSRVLTIAMLFGGGFALGRFAGYGGWKEGLSMTALGVALTVAIIALGG
jgi:VIT1/CCC1 family predicted Fe2+/Mn2+ transporter